MNRTTKVILSSMLAAGTVFGVGLSTDTPPVNQAHAATAPYYSFTGYAVNHASFVLNQTTSNLAHKTLKTNQVTNKTITTAHKINTSNKKTFMQTDVCINVFIFY